jgi:hypothetical protein
MKKALISPLEPVYDFNDPPQKIGDRVAEVSATEFPVAPPLFWTDCADDVVADEWYWNEGQFYLVPSPPPPPPVDPTNPLDGPTVI